MGRACQAARRLARTYCVLMRHRAAVPLRARCSSGARHQSVLLSGETTQQLALNSLSSVGSAGAPRCLAVLQRLPRRDLQMAGCTPRCARNCTPVLTGHLADILPSRSAPLHTVPVLYTDRAQRRWGTTQHFVYRLPPHPSNQTSNRIVNTIYHTIPYHFFTTVIINQKSGKYHKIPVKYEHCLHV